MALNLAVLISGGKTLQNFLDEIVAGRLDAKIQIVVASNARAHGIERARAAGIPAQVIDRRDFEGAVELLIAVLERLDAETIAELSKGVPYFRHLGVEHDVIAVVHVDIRLR